MNRFIKPQYPVEPQHIEGVKSLHNFEIAFAKEILPYFSSKYIGRRPSYPDIVRLLTAPPEQDARSVGMIDNEYSNNIYPGTLIAHILLYETYERR